MIKAYKYRLYPTPAQEQKLEFTLEICRELYNAAIEERRSAYKYHRLSITYADQQNQLPEIKKVRPDVGLVHSQVLQDVLRRVDRSFDGFFRRVARGERAGYPRFKSKTRYDSFTYPQTGFSIVGSRLKLSKIGHIKLRQHRAIAGVIKTCQLKGQAGRWYVCFSVENKAESLPVSSEVVGIDVGLSAFATLSNGEEIANPVYYRKAQRKLRIAQRKVARRNKGSHRRRKAVRELQRAHEHVRNQRLDFHHKVAYMLVMMYGLIVIENLNIKGMARGMLAKSVMDAGWGGFISILTYKAEEAGRKLVKVDPGGTSQTCICGTRVEKELKDRWHECKSCGISVPRDHMSAQVILKLGLGSSLRAQTCPVAESVAREAVCL
jgi:putative transposase